MGKEGNNINSLSNNAFSSKILHKLNFEQLELRLFHIILMTLYGISRDRIIWFGTLDTYRFS